VLLYVCVVVDVLVSDGVFETVIFEGTGVSVCWGMLGILGSKENRLLQPVAIAYNNSMISNIRHIM
jgi:hypothetical protein